MKSSQKILRKYLFVPYTIDKLVYRLITYIMSYDLKIEALKFSPFLALVQLDLT